MLCSKHVPGITSFNPLDNLGRGMVYYYPHFKDEKTEADGVLPKVTQVASAGVRFCIQFYLVPKPMLLTISHTSPQDVGGAHLQRKALNKQEVGCH